MVRHDIIERVDYMWRMYPSILYNIAWAMDEKDDELAGMLRDMAKEISESLNNIKNIVEERCCACNN